MECRTNPKVFCREVIKVKSEEVGYIQLVSYMRGDDIIEGLLKD